jgi:hypothetical protein
MKVGSMLTKKTNVYSESRKVLIKVNTCINSGITVRRFKNILSFCMDVG